MTSLFDHEWRQIDEGQGQRDQQMQLDETLWSSVVSIAGKRGPVAGSGCLGVDPGDQELCVPGGSRASGVRRSRTGVSVRRRVCGKSRRGASRPG